MRRLGAVALFLFNFILGGAIILFIFNLSFAGLAARNSAEVLAGILTLGFSFLLLYLWIVTIGRTVKLIINSFKEQQNVNTPQHTPDSIGSRTHGSRMRNQGRTGPRRD